MNKKSTLAMLVMQESLYKNSLIDTQDVESNFVSGKVCKHGG